MKPLHIAAGIIRNPRGDIFITRRPAGVHMAHKWEFPGGKLEAAETPADALARELWEETGIRPTHKLLFDVQRRPLPESDRHITLWFYLVTAWHGTPHGKEGQPCRWLPQTQLNADDFPPTNAPVVQKLLCKGCCAKVVV